MIFSLGHSTLPKQDFIDACHLAGVKIVCDVRSHPGSAVNPQYSRASKGRATRMRNWLAKAGIGYEWWPGLGGWIDRHAPLASEFTKHDVDVLAYCNDAFPRHRINMPCPHGGFSCMGFHDYQWFQTLPEYRESVLRLLERQDENLAMICCEARFVMCHRAMIADHLGVLGVEVQHIEPRFRKIKLPSTVVKLTGHGKFLEDRLTRYDQAVLDSWHQMMYQASPVPTT